MMLIELKSYHAIEFAAAYVVAVWNLVTISLPLSFSMKAPFKVDTIQNLNKRFSVKATQIEMQQ